MSPGGSRQDGDATRSAAYWDDVARAGGRAGESLWRRHADRATLALLERWLPSRPLGRVLKTDLYDESCTAGLVPALSGRARRVVGIDLSSVACRAARGAAPVEVVTGDVRRLPFRSGVFDAIVSNSTLDHFSSHAEIARGLRELERVLAPNGVLVVTLDNPVHPLVRLRNVLAPVCRRLGIVPYALGATYGPGGLRTALVASGFDVVAMTAAHHFPRIVLVMVERVLPRALRARVDRALLDLAHRLEVAERWPTRFLSGQYVAALARPVRPAAAAVQRGAAA